MNDLVIILPDIWYDWTDLIYISKEYKKCENVVKWDQS